MENYISYLPYAFVLIVALPFLVLLRQWVYFYMQSKNKELKLLSLQKTPTIPTQAYERMAIFLERIKPAYLIQNFNDHLAPHEFLYLTEKSINQEFEYNISQQIYIKKDLWEAIVEAKNSILSQLKTSYEQLQDKATLEEYKTVFLLQYIEKQDLITETIDLLRKEVTKN
ncbi:hypothetical protein [Riemerella columbina]|uniref:DUF7935 family protein n=1 Tax=Riemerella columbina TaxID=103810 RepID=UPI00266F8AB3|nr:hypothetical protein [Riemerella columbina]WKS96066.1 hypothetical protein NYR17_04865 [Riemerella columbina]